MDYSISEERLELLASKFLEFNCAEQEPDKAFFDTITNPVELHVLAGNHNWDDGVELLDWIIDSPRCDKATAVMTFWHAQPHEYTAFATAQEASSCAEVYTLLHKIMANLESGVYTTQVISYNPYLDIKAPRGATYGTVEKWSIPDDLRQPVSGEFEVVLY